MKPAPPMPVTVDAVARTLGLFTYRFADECALHDLVEQTLAAAGMKVEREVRLDARNLIDLLVDGRIGVEVKVAGQPSDVLRQLTRYAHHPTIEGLVLVTNRVRHTAPAFIGPVPVHVVCTIGGAA